MADRPIFPGSVKIGVLDIENADGTTAQDLITAGTNGAKVQAISVTSDDTAAIDLIFNYNTSSTDYGIGRITIPIGSGTDGTNQTVNVLNTTNFPFLRDDLSILLGASAKITVAAATAVTAAKKIQVVAYGADF